MAESTLTILKFGFLALLYFFLYRVIRVVYLEMSLSRRAAAAPVAQPAGPAPAAQAMAAPVSVPSGRRGRRKRGNPTPTRLRVLEPAEAHGRAYDLGPEITVGRAPGCGVCITGDTYVSQLHARVFVDDDTAWVEDLGSTNGTHLNGKRVESPMPLRRGDHLQVGGTVMEVQ